MARKKIVEIVLDTETTGLDYTREKMVEFAAVRLENGKIKDEFQTLINPEQHIRKSSIAIHGITEEMVVDAPTEAEAMPKILEFIGDYPIVAHNAIFDYSFLNEAAKRVTGEELKNERIDTQQMFKEVYPDLEAHGLNALTEKFNVELKDHHRAMGDTMGLALAYPKLKKLYVQKYDWESKQLENVDYLFERFLRLQQTVTTLQSEMQDLKSVFKLYFEQGGAPITSQEGDMLVYNSKQSFGYDFNAIKPVLEEVGALEKAVKIIGSGDAPPVTEKMISGVIIRHLILPGRLGDTELVLDWLKQHADNVIIDEVDHSACISLMSQYTPVNFKNDSQQIAQQRQNALQAFQNRLLNKDDFSQIQKLIASYEFGHLFYQELDDDTGWLPDFSREQPFTAALAEPVWHYKAVLH